MFKKVKRVFTMNLDIESYWIVIIWHCMQSWPQFYPVVHNSWKFSSRYLTSLFVSQISYWQSLGLFWHKLMPARSESDRSQSFKTNRNKISKKFQKKKIFTREFKLQQRTHFRFNKSRLSLGNYSHGTDRK